MKSLENCPINYLFINLELFHPEPEKFWPYYRRKICFGQNWM